MNDPINNYFASKGLDVSYNTLNSTEELIRAYVKDFQQFADNTKNKWSHYAKSRIYETLYPFEERKKSTGFEEFKKLDKKFRLDVSPYITETQLSPTLFLNSNENTKIDISFKETLKKRVKEFKHNPLVYYSGGKDSELVMLAMLETNTIFTPVIFEFHNRQGLTTNNYDLLHAYEFCAKHGLYPILKKINIDELWRSREFVELAINLQISSPQLVTHAWMIETMRHEFSDRTHVFGGEVRFQSNTIIENNEPSNMVLLNKIANLNLPWNVINSLFYGDTNYISLYVYADTASIPGNEWKFYAGRTSNSPLTRTWYTVTGSPSPTFYVRTSFLASYNLDDPFTQTYDPVGAGSYAAIPSGGVQLAWAQNAIGTLGTDSLFRVTFTVSIYGSAGGVGTAASGTVQLAPYLLLS